MSKKKNTVIAEWKALKKPKNVIKDTAFTLLVSITAGGIFMGLDTLMQLLHRLF